MSGVPAATAAPAHPPRSWQQALFLARYQLRDYLRSRRFVLTMGIVAAAVAIITGLFAYFRPVAGPNAATAIYSGPWAGGVIFVIIVAGIIYGGDAIAGEFQNRTGYFLMGLPVRRAAVYAGKYVAAFAASSVAVVLYLAAMIGNAAYFGGTGAFTVPGPLLASVALALLYQTALLGTVFLFSSMFKQSLYAALVVAILFLFGWSLLQGTIVALAHLEPWFLISYAEPIVGYPFGAAPPHAVAAGPFTVYAVTMLEGIGILVGYFLWTSLLGLFLFEREEFT